MSMWAQGFEPRQDQANCGPGTKNCGKICIAQGSECHIGKGKVGLAQTIGGAALFGAGFAAAAQGNNAAALGLAAGGLGLYARGQYNIGRSIGHSTPVGGAAKLLTGVQPTPLGLGAAAMGIHKAQKSVRPAVDYPVGAAFKPQPGQEYTAMTPEEYSSYRKREGANALKPAGVDEWGTMIMPLAARNQQPRVNPSRYSITQGRGNTPRSGWGTRAALNRNAVMEPETVGALRAKNSLVRNAPSRIAKAEAMMAEYPKGSNAYRAANLLKEINMPYTPEGKKIAARKTAISPGRSAIEPKSIVAQRAVQQKKKEAPAKLAEIEKRLAQATPGSNLARALELQRKQLKQWERM